jgi:hypothetical protein
MVYPAATKHPTRPTATGIKPEIQAQSAFRALRLQGKFFKPFQDFNKRPKRTRGESSLLLPSFKDISVEVPASPEFMSKITVSLSLM